jgi:hypothetical protein
MKSDETNEITELNDGQKKEVQSDLYDIFHKDKDEDDFKEKYKDNPLALKQLDEAKDFWKRFPKINFYDKSVVDSLKEEFKDNLYILGRINRESKS